MEYDDIPAVFMIVAVMVVLTFIIISVGVGGYDKGKYEVWKQAVDKGYAQEVETSEGKVFQWK